MRKWILLGLFSVSLLLRVINLPNLPAGFTPDEASFAYDAYSLIKTGKDQWGVSWPMVFKSFGDYKLPLYTYLSIPFVAVLGLNETAVRLPNVLLGSLAVPFVFLLVSEMYDKRQRVNRVALLASLFLMFSPWHIMLSRGAFEANLTTFFMTSGVYFFLVSRRNDKYLILSMFLFGLNLFTYHSARLITPLIVMMLICFYRGYFPKTKVYTIPGGIFLGLFLLAIVSLFSGAGERGTTSTLLSQNLGSGVTRAQTVNAGMHPIVGKFLYNEPIAKATKFATNYLSYLSPNFLYSEGARETSYGMIPGIGVLSIIEFLGVVVFVLFLLNRLEKNSLFMVGWILAGIIPAAISIGPGHAANRVAVIVPAIQIVSAMGLFHLTYLFARLKIKHLVSILSVLIVLVGLVTYVRYFYEQPSVSNYPMVYGMRETFSFLKQYPHKRIILSRSISEPHIYAAFFDPIEPELYQLATNRWDFKEKGLSWVDQQDGYFVGRYVISSIDKSRDFNYSDTFVVGKREEMPESARIVKTILSPSKTELWVIAEKNI